MTGGLVFRTSEQRRKHFRKHGAKFGAVSAIQYEEFASNFLTAALNSHSEDCARRQNNDYIRFDSGNNVIGIISFDGFIKTYFKPDPAVHGFSTNRDYYLCECNQR